MMRNLLIPLVLVLSCATAAAQTLQLKGGHVLLAEMESAHADGLTVRRLDNGGVLELRWDDLTPECARRLQEAQGLIAEDDDEVTVEAHAVSYESAGAPLEIIGRIIERTPAKMVVEKLGQQISIDPRKITGTRTIQVPVSQIYTDEQFYALTLGEFAPGSDPDKHVNLADYLMRARDYTRAEQHFVKAKELGGGTNGPKLDRLIQRAQLYQKAEKERTLLAQIRARRSRGARNDFDMGRELIAQFERDHAESPLYGDFEREKQRFEQARERYLVKRVTELWKRLIRSTASARIGQGKLNLTQAREYAENEMGEAIAARVAQQMELEPKEAAELFGRRAEVVGSKKTEQFFYGIGTWVLGEDRIIDKTKQGEREENITPTQDRDLERLARKLREARERAMRAMRGAGGGGAGAQEKDTPDKWWEKASRNEKTSFLRAYYVEFGGDLEVVKAYVKPCVNCSGAGREDALSPEGKRIKLPCFLCREMKFTRSVVAK